MTDALKTVVTASGMLEAEILRGMMEAHGIPVMLSHESAMSAYSVGVGPLAQVEVLVPEAYLPQAEALLDDYISGRLETPDQDEDSVNPDQG